MVKRVFKGGVRIWRERGAALIFLALIWGMGEVLQVGGQRQGVQGTNLNEQDALEFLQRNEEGSTAVCNSVMEASWNYHTNATDYNRRLMLATQLQGAGFRRQMWREASSFRWKSFRDRTLRRMFSLLTVLNGAVLPEEERREYAELLQEMKQSYSNAKICLFNPNRPNQRGTSARPRTTLIRGISDADDLDFQYEDYDVEFQDDDDVDDDDGQRRDSGCIPTLKLEPDLVRIMAESRNPEELRYVWRAWREAVGRPLRGKYLRFMRLSNRAARLNGFNDTSQYLKKDYESEILEDDLERIWVDVKPLYEQLHAYVRRKLRQRYEDETFNPDGTIPAHLLGDMWGQSWLNLLDLTVPFPGRPFMDVTQAMRRQGYTATRIFRTAEDFFTSLGLSPLPISFWLLSMLEKPNDRDVICHASAWDFCNGRDYRIKQCTEVNMKNLITAHHELGHVYYAMGYRKQPLVYRDGANPGFHEAIGDAISLSVITPTHLAKIGLLSADTTSYEDDINFLLTTALDKVAFLPFGFLVDKWRWKVFSRDVKPREMNNYWWQLRVIYQGVTPPLFRSPFEFDPGAKYHVPANIPYIRYFVSYILQFQIHEELCRVAGHTGPLHKCDIYGSTEAGDKIKRLMRLGKSQSWRVVLSELTEGRTNRLDARPLLRYFRNLNDWLVRQNREDQVGWFTNEALFALTGALVNTSSATFIGVLVGACAGLFLLGCLSVYCYRKLNSDKRIDSVAS